MKIQKLTALFCSALLSAGLVTGCGSSTSAFDYSNQTVTAQITSIDGTTLTLQTGTYEESQMPEMNEGKADDGTAPEMNEGNEDGSAPEKPEDAGGGSAPEMTEGNEGGSAPEKPEDAGDGSAPEMPEDVGDGSAPEMPEENGEGTAPEMPEENGEGTAPEMPEDAGDGSAPEMPDGNEDNAPAGQQNAQPGGNDPGAAQGDGTTPDGQQDTQPGGSFTASNEDAVTVTVSEALLEGLNVNDIIEITFGDGSDVEAVNVLSSENMQMPENGGGNGGGNGDIDQGTTAEEITSDLEGTTLTSESNDENAGRVTGNTVTLTDLAVNKTGDATDTDAANFYGNNAGILATDAAEVTINGGSFTTSGSGANAVFSYGSNTTVTISNAKIRTSGDNSGGIQTAGGGTTIASDLDIETDGNSSAAIRSDRGGGTVQVTGGTYTTNGTGSPAVYSTADITVTDAVLTANASEAIVVEGENSVTLENCTVTGNMTGTYNDSSENIHNVMIYQSTSGDAEEGTALFKMTGGSLIAKQGDLFYVTNTACEIDLTGVELTTADGTILNIAGNSSERGWGEEGSNGGSAVVNCSGQELNGNILVDEISSLDLTLADGSTFTGSVNPDGEAGTVNLTLSSDSTWILTGDAYLTSYDGDLSSIQAGSYHVYVNGELLV